MNRLLKIFFLLGFCSLHAVHYEKVDPDIKAPWFTGPLIATSATTIPGGHIDIEPYMFATNNFATYNGDWESKNQPDFFTLSYQVPFWIGLCSWADVVIQPTLNWNHTKSQSKWTFGDFIAGIEFQLNRSSYRHKNWVPSIKLALWETFPTGKYRNSSPHSLRTDIGGAGAYSSELRLIIGRLENIYDDHFFKWELNFNYTLPSNVKVKGINAYGGGSGTNGTAKPGKNFEMDLGLEYNLTQNWALAMDLVATWQTKSHFHGINGVTSTGQTATNVTKSYSQYSIAPAIEYNFSANTGLIAGMWFTVAGRNVDRFYSGVIALNYFK